MKDTNNRFKSRNVFLIFINFILVIVLFITLIPNYIDKNQSLCPSNHYMIYDKKTEKNKCVKEGHFKTENGVGDVTELQIPKYESVRGFKQNLAAKTEYEEKTNKWFNNNFSISTGEMKPLEDIQVQLGKLPNDLKIRYQLTERDSSLKKVKLIKEEVTTSNIFNTYLPNKQDTLYILSAEVLGKNGKVEDTLLSLIYTQSQSMNAKLYIDKESYKINDNVILNLENFGPTYLSTGYPYTVEKYKQGKWENVNFNGMFTFKGLAIKSGDKLEQTLKLENFEKGEYRITKSFNGGEIKSQKSLSVYFKIVD